MLRKNVLVLTFLILVLTCCTKVNEQNKLIFEHSSTALVDANNNQLLSFEYQIANQSNVDSGPLYVNFVFHDKLLQEYLSLTSYSGHKQMGLEGITLKAGETYKGGDSLDFIERGVNPELIEKIVTKNKAIEIQIVDLHTDQIVTTSWINTFSYVDEAGVLK